MTSVRAGVHAFLLSSLIASVDGARAETSPDGSYELTAESRTYLQLYRRALLPGSGAALVDTETLVPLHQFVSIEARGLDLSFQADGLTLELSAWGRYDFAETERSERLDGDLRTASARIQFREVTARLGRQVAAGGAARYVRFDGASMAWEPLQGFEMAAYGGFTVLPPAFRRRGYRLLGASPEVLRTGLPYFESPRDESWLAGARVEYSTGARYALALSFHHQAKEDELDHRRLGADARARFGESTDCAARAVVDTDALSFAEALLSCDVYPHPAIDVTGELFRAEPALWLSRSSVLSVFSTADFEEAGLRARFRALRDVTLESHVYLDHYSEGEFGGRGGGSATLRPEGTERLLVMLAYARFVAAENAYHVLRGSLRRRLFREVTGTLDSHFYRYDAPIAGYRVSAVHSATLEAPVHGDLRVLLSGSMARSPYARVDAQGVVRLSYEPGPVRP